MGIEKETAMGVLRDAVAEATPATTNGLADMTGTMDDAADAVAAMRHS